MTSAVKRPARRLGSIVDAFNLLGKRLYASDWTGEEARAVRLGMSGAVDDAIRQRGHDVRGELLRCVQEGWLPLLYFDGHGQRTWYYDQPGAELVAIYPLPRDDEPGQVELGSGDIFDAQVDLDAFRAHAGRAYRGTIASKKKQLRAKVEGWARGYYQANKIEAEPGQVIDWLIDQKRIKAADLPPPATLYRWLENARSAVRSATVLRTENENGRGDPTA